ncbi:MAG: hypothetical protein ACPGQS_10640, partial [Bradymonadia bacterium]
MESIGKKMFWVINLILLAAIAFLGTRTAGTWFGATLVGLEIPEVKDKNSRPTTEKPKLLSATLADDIVNRNIFNSTPPQPEEPSAESKEDGEEEENAETRTPPGPDEECEASASSLKASVTLVAQPEEWSMAVVVADRKERIVKVRDLIEGSQVAAIHQHRVVLLRAGQYECLYIEKKKKDKKDKYKSSRDRSKSRSRSSGKSKNAAKIKEGVVKKGAGQYEIDRSM